MPDIPSIDPKRLGRRLTEARKACGMTQQDVADHIQCSRPTLIAIEKGSRPAKPEEIVALASLYGRTVHELVRPSEPIVSLQPHLRAVANKLEPGSEELVDAIDQLQQFAENYKELEELLNAPMTYNYPPEVRLTDRVNVDTLAEDIAVSERNRLGLGDQPIYDLRRLLESDVGLRIMYGSLPSHIAGLYAHTGELGSCILINARHPSERQRASLAHEYGHVISDRYRPGVDYLDQRVRKPANERFAEKFAMNFLMPATSVRRRFNDTVSATDDFHVADLCRLSHLYYVSVEAMAYRLEGLQLIPPGTIQHLRESRFEIYKAKDILQLPARRKTEEAYPERYTYLAVQAYEEAKISEGELARYLNTNPVAAREIVQKISQGIDVTDEGELKQSRFDFQKSLLPDA